MTNSGIIYLNNLSKRYGSKEVLRVTELTVRQGCITGIIGPSGAGKSTLLRILNLLDSPTSGDIFYYGQKIPESKAELLALRRKMSMVFQKSALLEMSVYDNLAFGLRARKMPEGEIEKRASTILETIDLAGQSKQRAKTLSGGEAQRLAFARAVVLRPEILFLDEPTANLDPANVELLERLVVQLSQEYGTTVLIVTHNLFQAQRLTQETVFFCQGDLVEAGVTEQIFAAPCCEQTDAFVRGRMIY